MNQKLTLKNTAILLLSIFVGSMAVILVVKSQAKPDSVLSVRVVNHSDAAAIWSSSDGITIFDQFVLKSKTTTHSVYVDKDGTAELSFVDEKRLILMIINYQESSYNSESNPMFIVINKDLSVHTKNIPKNVIAKIK